MLRNRYERTDLFAMVPRLGLRFDPLLRRRFGRYSFDSFTRDNRQDPYTALRFRMVKAEILFYPSWTSKAVGWLANHWPGVYERCFWRIYPAWMISVRLEVVKAENRNRSQN
jgi:hypothetical protein